MTMFRYICLFMLLSNSAFAQFASGIVRDQSRPSIFSQFSGPREVSLDEDIKIVMVINGEMVSTKDINERVRALSYTMNVPINTETKDMLVDRVKQVIIDEKLKIFEATKEDIKVSIKDIDSAIENIAAGNRMSYDELIQNMRNAGVDEEVYKEQIKSELAWIKLIQQKTRGNVEVGLKEAERFVEEIEKSANFEKVKISEIVIPKKDAANIDVLVSNLNSDPRFDIFAMQFSMAPSSARGGDLGWVNKEVLLPIIKEKLETMSEGEISDIIEIGDDYYIIKLEKVYNPKEDNIIIPSLEEAIRIIENKKLEDFAKNYMNKIHQKSVVEYKD